MMNIANEEIWKHFISFCQMTVGRCVKNAYANIRDYVFYVLLKVKIHANLLKILMWIFLFSDFQLRYASWIFSFFSIYFY